MTVAALWPQVSALATGFSRNDPPLEGGDTDDAPRVGAGAPEFARPSSGGVAAESSGAPAGSSGSGAASGTSPSTRRGVSGMTSLAPTDSLNESIRPFVPGAAPPPGTQIATSRGSTAVQQSESVGNLRPHSSGSYQPGGANSRQGAAPTHNPNQQNYPGGGFSGPSSSSDMDSGFGANSRGRAPGANPYLQSSASRAADSGAAPVNYDPFSPARRPEGGQTPQRAMPPAAGGSAPHNPNQGHPGQQATAPGRNPFGSGQYTAAPASRPTYDPFQPQGQQYPPPGLPISRPAMDPSAPHQRVNPQAQQQQTRSEHQSYAAPNRPANQFTPSHQQPSAHQQQPQHHVNQGSALGGRQPVPAGGIPQGGSGALRPHSATLSGNRSPDLAAQQQQYPRPVVRSNSDAMNARPAGPLGRPGLDPVAGRPVVAQGVRPDAAAARHGPPSTVAAGQGSQHGPISRPGLDAHGAPARHGVGGASSASRPAMEPYHPNQGRPSSKPQYTLQPEANPGGTGALVRAQDSDFREVLDRLAIDPPLGDAEVQALAGALFRCTVGANKVLFGQGEKADITYFLASGLARMEFAAPGRPVEAVGCVKPGDIIGEGAIVGGDSHIMTVAAGTECVFFALGSAQFAELTRSSPGVAVRLLAVTALQQVRRLRADARKVDQFAAGVLGIVAPAAAAADPAAAPTALGRLFQRFSGTGKDE